MFPQAAKKREPLAIVGIGCRFPGGSDTPITFWNHLLEGQDAIIDIPEDRWSLRRFYHPNPEAPGKIYVRQGGFLRHSFDRFDAAFFGITPREAAALDPQQRALLEVSYEAFEDAGMTLNKVRGSRTGVYVGAFTMDNLSQQLGVLSREQITTHTAVSTTMTMLSNRVSYVFDLCGPSLSVDTACSSSLVALHLACQALWNGECDTALAGGVNMMFRPEFVIAMCKGHFLSPEARCKAFDHRADGYVRGEGAGMVLLKPFEQAVRDNDRIYALVQATGSNQDGHTNGITVPNGAAQEALVRAVCAQAGITPGRINYLEAHGTGTQAGDPIEAQSLGAALSTDRPEGDKCWIGSVKTNIGHLEAAAGIASVIKAALMIRYAKIPPHLHFSAPNPQIDLETLRLRIPTQVEPLPSRGGIAYVGVNSFGYGGTNAHALLSSPPPRTVDLTPAAPPLQWIVPLTAATPEALHETVKVHHERLKELLDPKDYAYTTARRRTHHPTRVAFVGGSRDGILAQMEEYIRDGAGITGSAGDTRPLVFVFTGMGPQWWGMGQELLRESRRFRETIHECDQIFRKYADWSLLELFERGGGHPMSDPIHAQPANFAIQAALTEVWRDLGVTPQAAVGHSAGEIAAAYAAGSLSLEDGLRVTYWRCWLMQRTVGHGAMLAAGLSPAAAETLIRETLNGSVDQVGIAAINSPQSVTLAGDPGALKQVAAQLEAKGLFNAFLKLEVAYHSYQMSPLEGEFRSALHNLRAHAPHFPLYSTVTGALIRENEQECDYWWRNARQPVQLAPALNQIIRDGYRTFLEVGPHPVLSAAIQDNLREARAEGISFASLRRGKPESETLFQSFGGLWANGVEVNWAKVYPKGRQISLPAYRWQRESLWVESPRAKADRLDPDRHPLLGRQMPDPVPTWEADLGAYYLDYLHDHRIQGAPIFPAAGYVEAVLAAGGSLPLTLENLELRQAIPLDSAAALVVKLNEGQCQISSRTRDDLWSSHAQVNLLSKGLPPLRNTVDLTLIQARCGVGLEVNDLYTALQKRGLEYGKAFRPLQGLWLGDREALAHLELDAGLWDEAEHYQAHPALLDGAFQTFTAFLGEADQGLYIPASIRQVRAQAQIPVSVWVHAVLSKRAPRYVEGNLTVLDSGGQTLMEVTGLRLHRIGGVSKAESDAASWFYELSWELDQHDLPSAPPGQRWLIFKDRRGVGERVGAALRAQGDTVAAVEPDHRDLSDPAVIRQILEAHPPAEMDGIIFGCGLDLTALDDDDPRVVGLEPSAVLLAVVQVLHELDPHYHLKHLFILSANAEQVLPSDLVQAPGQAALWGIGRVILNEHAGLQARLIDLCLPELDDPALGPDLAQIVRVPGEPEIGLREGRRYAHRLAAVAAPPPALIAPTPELNYSLRVGQPGILDSLTFHQMPRRAPETGEIEVRIEAAALNFKDLMKVMNLLSEAYLENTFFSEVIGLESAGEIVALGAGVTEQYGFKVGDPVVVFHGGGGFQRYITLPASWALIKPTPLTYAQSVVFINFVTAYYSLIDVARLRKGERVLIHAATGGVGLAAIQVAQSVGAEIFATAGTPEKRESLRALGIKYISDSRSLQFYDDIQAWTHGAGVDVVLNTLWGEALTKSLELLAPYGRFVEIGKRDITANARLALGAFDRGLTFAAVDLDKMMVDRPDLYQEALRSVHERLESGILKPLPTQIFGASQAAEAFRLMAGARHIGKITVDMGDQNLSIEAMPDQSPLIHDQGTYLVTGGLGGFGLETARWLVTQGARHLVLISRSGASTEGAQSLLAHFAAQGVHVHAAKVDVSDWAQVSGLMATIRETMPPLKGVIHSAMVLDDDVMIHLDRERFERVLGPKAGGAWNLHRATLDQPLDFFVLFSSVSAYIGNPRQANYVAANCFLDALAHYRRARGLPALSLNWGSIGKVGAVARNPKVEQYLTSLGVNSLDPEAAASALGELLRRGAVQTSVVNMNWARWANSPLNVTDSPIYANLVAGYRNQGGSGGQSLRSALRAAPIETHESLVGEFLRAQIAKVTRLPLTRLEPSLRLDQLGIDSLMGVELNNLIRVETDVEFSVMTLMQGLTIQQLAGKLLEKLSQD